MFSLQRFFGKPDKFFTLLEASAAQAKASIEGVVRVITNPEQTPSLDEFVLSRRKEKRITEEISEELVKTFVTALDREDIEELARSLYRIPKTAEKFAERFILGIRIARSTNFGRHVALLGQAADTLVEMVRGLREQMNLAKMKEHNDRLQYFEGEADKLMLDHYRELYDGTHEATSIFILKDLFEILETCVDCCRDTGNVIYNIVLKNS